MSKQEKSAAELYREERKKRIAKAAKSNSKKHISEKAQKSIFSAIAIVVVIAIVGAIAGGIVKNKGIFERNKTIMTIGETEIDKYEYSYYYSQMLQQIASTAAQYDMYYGAGMGALYSGYDYTKTPEEQPYTLGEIEGVEEPTFADYFSQQAVSSLKYIKACVAYAAENDITLTEEDYASIESTFDQIDKSRVNDDGSKYSVGAYLRLSYGDGMTEALFRRILEEQTLAQRVMTVVQEGYAEAYTEEEVEAAYQEGIEKYGLVTLRNYTFSVTAAEEGAEPTDAEKAEAKAKAEEFASKITDEESFKTLAAAYAEEAGNENPESFTKDDTLTLVADTTLSDLLADEALVKWAKTAKAGETYVAESDASYGVYYMVEPVHKAADKTTYDVRHILIEFPNSSELVTEGNAKKEEVAEFDASKYDVTVENVIKTPITDITSYNKAVDVLTSYLEGDKTESAFAALAVEYSSDSNAADGGIYEGVTIGKMVSEFEDWALDEDRVKGDVGIVETVYGYHIMYHIGVNTTTWSDTIRNDLATEKYNTFYDELIAGENVKAGEIDEEMSADIDAKMATLAKNLYKQYQSYMSSYGY